MEKSIEELVKEVLANTKIEEPKIKIRAPRSSLHRLIKTRRQAAIFMLLMKAEEEGLLPRD